MSKLTHTPERWYKVSALTPRGTIVTDIITGNTIIAQLKGDEGKAYAARIVACVNACAGIPNEVLLSDSRKNDAFFQAIEFETEVHRLRARISELEEQLKRNAL